MTAIGEHFWQYGIRCDHEGCKATLWRVAKSEALALNQAQTDAKRAGWSVARDRVYGMGGEGADPKGLAATHMSRDLCPEHARLNHNPRALP